MKVRTSTKARSLNVASYDENLSATNPVFMKENLKWEIGQCRQREKKKDNEREKNIEKGERERERERGGGEGEREKDGDGKRGGERWEWKERERENYCAFLLRNSNYYENLLIRVIKIP